MLRHSSRMVATTHLGVDELDDAGFALQPAQQVDLVHKALRRLGVEPRQPDALQRIHLPLWRYDLRIVGMPAQPMPTKAKGTGRGC